MPSTTNNGNSAEAEDILKKSLNELNMSLKDKQKLLKANSKALKETNSVLEKTHEKITSIKKATSELSSLKDVSRVFDGLLKFSVTFATTKVAMEMIKFNSELHRTVINAGKSKKELETYKNTVINLSSEMGALHEDANNVAKTLAKLQYAGTAKDINDAAKASYGFARAFGLNYEEITENTVELQKWGQLSAKTTSAIYADTMKVAQANGLTNNAAKLVIKSTKEWSGTLKAFGKSAIDVQKYNMSLAKTVSALEKVGVSAGTVTKLIEDLMDPENIEDNIPKYAALGISITDAITGNIDPEKMASGLKDFGEKLKQMGPIAGAQYAKAMGVSYKDAIKAASADMSEASKVDMTPEEKSVEVLKQLSESTKDNMEKMQDNVQKVGAVLRSLGPMFLLFAPVIIQVFSKIITKIKDKVFKTTKETMHERIEEYKKSENDIEEVTKKSLKQKLKEWDKAEKEKGELSIKEAEKQRKREAKENAKQKKALAKMDDIFLKNLHKKKIQKNSSEYKNELQKYKEFVNTKLIAEVKALNKEQTLKKNALNKMLNKRARLEEEMNKATTKRLKKQLKERLDETEKAIKAAGKAFNKIKDNTQSKKNELRNSMNKVGKNIDSKYSAPKESGGIVLKGLGKKIINGVAGAVGKVPGMIGKVGQVIIKGLGKAVGKVFSFLKSTLGKVLGSIGALALIGGLLSKVIGKFQEPLQDIMDSVVNSLEPIFKAVGPIIANLLSTLARKILPPTLKLLALLLKALSPIIWGIRQVLGALSHIPGLGFLKDISDSLGEIAGDKTQKALLDAANNVAETDHTLAKKTEENTEAMSKKEQITVNNGKVSISKAQGSTSSSEQSNSTGSNNSSASKTESSKNFSQDRTMTEMNKAMEKSNKELSEIKKVISNYFKRFDKKGGEKAMEIRAGIQQAFNLTGSGDAIPVSLDIFSTANNFIGKLSSANNVFELNHPS